MSFRNRFLRYEILEARNLLAAVEMPDAITADSAGTVTVPVEIDNAIGMRAAEIRIAYDTATFDVDSEDITAGSVWQDRGAVMARVDEEVGEIVVFAFAAQSLTVESGTLVDIEFNLRDDACNDTARIDLTKVRVDDGNLELARDPVAGVDGIDGLIVIDDQTSPSSDSTLLVSKVPRVVISQRPALTDVNSPALVPFPKLLPNDSFLASKINDAARDDVLREAAVDFVLAKWD